MADAMLHCMPDALFSASFRISQKRNFLVVV